MGVPIFCILFGFLAGWFTVKYLTVTACSVQQVLRQVLRYAAMTSSFTLLVMVLIWGPALSMLFDPSRDLANWGIPMILYEPLASFIGWMVLMMLISPFLQFLTTLFGSYLALLGWVNKQASIQEVSKI
jgi:hypothetical protein